ncbi:MAG: hypothetical protein ACI8QT_000375 [Halioglobus sp.]|jgi:hypothetical protein
MATVKEIKLACNGWGSDFPNCPFTMPCTATSPPTTSAINNIELSFILGAHASGKPG